jgi:hypothetical protein
MFLSQHPDRSKTQRPACINASAEGHLGRANRIAPALLGFTVALTLWLPLSNSASAQTVAGDAEKARSELSRIRDAIHRSSDLQFSTSISISSSLRRSNLSATGQFLTRKPNLLRVEAKDAKRSYVLVSDGKRATAYKPSTRQYAVYPARDSIIGTLYTAAGLLSVAGRMLDFFWAADSGQDLSVTSIPSIKLDGRECAGLKVDRFEESFEVWYEAVGNPLPCKLISRRLDGLANTVQTTMFKWTEKPVVADGAFSFVPPKGSRQVDFFDLQ